MINYQALAFAILCTLAIIGIVLLVDSRARAQERASLALYRQWLMDTHAAQTHRQLPRPVVRYELPASISEAAADFLKQ